MINLNYVFLNNEIVLYLKAVILFIVLILFLRIFSNMILKKLSDIAEKTKINIDDALIGIIKSIKPNFYIFVSFYLSLKFLNIPIYLEKALDIALLIWIVTQAMVAVQIIINYFATKFNNKDNPGDKAAIDLLTKAVKFVLWLIAILFILSNLGINITSFVAGLGIGGIAIAFALQSILSDLFSSFAIHFDRPFVVGDFIMFGNQKGVVEKIGIKTTRLRSSFGEEIVVSNQDLTSSVIQNFKKMKERRVVFNFRINYDTSPAKLKKIPKTIEDIINSFEVTRVDRVHFKDFGEYSLNFECSFYLKTPDYRKYMDVQQEINIKIIESFRKEKIKFAVPVYAIKKA